MTRGYKIVKPLGNHILVRAHKRDKIGGILLPDKRKEMEWKLEALAIGPDVKNVKAGDYVICPPVQVVFLTNWIDIEQDVGIIPEDKVMGIAI
jgi:co-chaperonin GroES (HSP10)